MSFLFGLLASPSRGAADGACLRASPPWPGLGVPGAKGWLDVEQRLRFWLQAVCNRFHCVVVSIQDITSLRSDFLERFSGGKSFEVGGCVGGPGYLHAPEAPTPVEWLICGLEGCG